MLYKLSLSPFWLCDALIVSAETKEDAIEKAVSYALNTWGVTLHPKRDYRRRYCITSVQEYKDIIEMEAS